MPRVSNDKDFKEMLNLISKSLTEQLIRIGVKREDAQKESTVLVKKYRHKIYKVIHMPYGGTLPPEELAEMVLVNSAGTIKKQRDEAAATVS